MELYTLDSLYRRIQVIDRFESLIWTERYSGWGEFELDIDSTLANRRLLPAGTRLAMNESYRVMEVETFENRTDSEGRNLLTVKGRSLEKILEDRVARGTLGDLTTTPKWSLQGLPAAIARAIFTTICVNGQLDPNDVIPMVIESGGLFPADTIPEPTTEILYEIDPMTVYQAIKDLCDIYDLGFRLVRNFDTGQLHWDVYSGSDRTTGQTTLPPVIFSPDLGNLQNTTELTSIASAKNVAYVFSPVGHEIVYPPDVDPDVAGFERRVLLVNATDIQLEEGEDPAVASEKMIQRGLDELAKHRSFSGFDGEVSQNSEYKYGRDYHLGDLVDQRNTDGVGNYMRVTEQIFVSDKEGERSYPTLAVSKFIQPGTWLAWDFNQVWEELTTEEWSDV